MRRGALLLGMLAAGCAPVAPRPEDPGARYARAALLAETDPAQALRLFDELLDSMPDHAAAHVGRGSVLQALGRPEEAAEAYARALALQPKSLTVRAARGLLLESLKRDPEAEAEYSAIIADTPENPDGYLLRARLLRRLGRFSEAMRDQGEAAAKDREGWTRHYNAGVDASRARRWSDARIRFELALLLSPGLGEAWLGLARAHAEEGRLEEALRAADKAVEARGGDDPDVWYARGEIRRGLGRSTEAIGDYTRSVQLYPKAHAFVARGLCHRTEGRLADALVDFDEAVRLDPRYRAAFVERARLLAKLERFDLAKNDYVAALGILASPDLIRELALFHAAREDWREAVYYLEQARGLCRPGVLREQIEMDLERIRERRP